MCNFILQKTEKNLLRRIIAKSTFDQAARFLIFEKHFGASQSLRVRCLDTHFSGRVAKWENDNR
jgi:hypothetical protein